MIKNITKFKAYFLILNVLFAIISFSYVVDAEDSILDKFTSLTMPTLNVLDQVQKSTEQSTSTPTPTGGAQVPTNSKGYNYNGWPPKQIKLKDGTFINPLGQSTAPTKPTAPDQQTAPQGETRIAPQSEGGKVNAWEYFEIKHRDWLSKLTPEESLSIKKKLEGHHVRPSDVDAWVKSLNEKQSNAQQGIQGYFKKDLVKNLLAAGAVGGVLGIPIGMMAGGKDGKTWGFVSGFVGTTVYQIAKSTPGITGAQAALMGVGSGLLIFLLTYKKAVEDRVEFNCLTWQAPLGGKDCELCNDLDECSEYVCKSLGQACDLVNAETEEEAMCVWKNPHDTNSPIIKMLEVNKEHKFVPDAMRPTGTGAVISLENGDCIKAFTPLEFTFTTKDSETGLGEPSQCKVDYNLTTSTKEDLRAGFEQLGYYVGGDTLFKYNHTEKLSLPGPDSVNAVAPDLHNDGTYTLYIRCQDANGNFNQDAYSVKFCVQPGPDTTAPLIIDSNVPSGNPIQFNQTNLDLEVYVNEPSECRWSREESTYENMENEMDCATELWEMNNENVYTCKTTLTGIEDRKENKYYFRCKDQPWADEGRIVNTQSYLYVIVGTQPLNILEVLPNETIFGSTDSIPVFLTIKTDNGHNNGEAICYYSITEEEEDYIQFLDSNETNIHEQRQDLVTGDYTYYVKCVDFAGNAAYNQTSFRVETDRQGPEIIRVYNEGRQLKIITNEKSECSYSFIDCNFEIDDGIKMSSFDYENHHAEWDANQNYYMRCKDKYENQPDPNVCSIIVRPSEINAIIPAIEL